MFFVVLHLLFSIDDKTDPTGPPSGALATYLNTPSVQKAFNAPMIRYEFCSSKPYSKLNDDEEQASIYQLKWVLNNKVAILFLKKICFTILKGSCDNLQW